MKKICVLLVSVLLASCGTMGIGSNHNTNIYNNSKNTISVKSDSGIYNIKPESNMVINSANDITITSKNKACLESTVARTPNVPAMLLDGLIFFTIVPILVDAVSNNLYRMPEMYSYSCIEK